MHFEGSQAIGRNSELWRPVPATGYDRGVEGSPRGGHVDKRRTPARLAALLAVLILAIAAGCGSGSSGSSSSAGGSSGGAKPGSGIKVGLVTDIGGLNGHGLHGPGPDAIKKAPADKGGQIKLPESKAGPGFHPEPTALGDRGYE